MRPFKSIIILFWLAAAGCGQKSNVVTTPTWATQNIDTVSSCNIIPCDRMKIIKVGNRYTASWDYGYDIFMYKVEVGDFGDAAWGIKYFDDSCILKEELRSFIRLQILLYKSYQK